MSPGKLDLILLIKVNLLVKAMASYVPMKLKKCLLAILIKWWLCRAVCMQLSMLRFKLALMLD